MVSDPAFGMLGHTTEGKERRFLETLEAVALNYSLFNDKYDYRSHIGGFETGLFRKYIYELYYLNGGDTNRLPFKNFLKGGMALKLEEDVYGELSLYNSRMDDYINCDIQKYFGITFLEYLNLEPRIQRLMMKKTKPYIESEERTGRDLKDLMNWKKRNPL